jgi:hypothetical protein
MSTSDTAEVERGFRKLAIHYGLKALSGVAIMVVVAQIPFPSKWWDLPFMIFGAGVLLFNLKLLSILASAFYRYRHGPEDTTPRKQQDRTERSVHIGSYVVLGTTILGMGLLPNFTENIVEEGRFVLVMGGVGVAIAAFVLWWIRHMVPDYYQRNSEARAGAVLGLFFSIVVLVVLGTAWADRTTAANREHVERYAVQVNSASSGTGAHFVFLLRPGRHGEDFRVQLRPSEIEAVMGQDSVDLLVGTGDLGFVHVLGVVH